MKMVFLVLAIVTLTLGHLIKIYRWNLFIKIYEKPNNQVLLQSLSFGYLINSFFPYHIGDLFRAYFSGKKMKNGISFSLATIIVDRFLDLIVIGTMFVLLFVFGFRIPIILNSILFYVICIIAIIIFGLFAIKYNKYVKIAVKKVAGIFNNSIELKFLKITWFAINAFKDMLHKISKKRLIYGTIAMWAVYFLSYTFFALSLKKFGYNIGLLDVLLSLFATGNLESSTIVMITKLTTIGTITLIYLIVPVILIFVISYFVKHSKFKISEDKYMNLLPYINENDKLSFLEAYFEANNREYFKNYLKINSDVSIIQDYSAGSNATTMLCTDDENMFYRKYAFGSAGEKLYEQVEWIEAHQKELPLTDILNVKKGEGYCCYDMPYLKESVGCFNFVHSSPIEISWNILETVLTDLNKKLYKQNSRKADKETIDKYISSKAVKNLEIITSTKEVKELSKFDYLIINGRKYRNLKFFDMYLGADYLYEIFKNDEYSDLHGDLTIENIICMQSDNKKKNSYYIIDPNTGNIHDSDNLDYAKLLQSLHGGYEFLMHTKSVEFEKNKINFLQTRTSTYDELFKRYKNFLEKNFSNEKVKSIFYHEIIHWLRLLPYKINKDRKRFVMFYAEFIIVLNEVIDFYEK